MAVRDAARLAAAAALRGGDAAATERRADAIGGKVGVAIDYSVDISIQGLSVRRGAAESLLDFRCVLVS